MQMIDKFILMDAQNFVKQQVQYIEGVCSTLTVCAPKYGVGKKI